MMIWFLEVIFKGGPTFSHLSLRLYVVAIGKMVRVHLEHINLDILVSQPKSLNWGPLFKKIPYNHSGIMSYFK